MTSLLSLRHVNKEYGDPVDPLHALSDISFDIEHGDVVCMVGPSGGGKSTLLRIIAGLLQATDGEIVLDGEPVSEPSPRVGIVFQNINLMPWRTVLDNVALPLELQGLDKVTRRRDARHFIELVQLDGYETLYPHQLSGGMQQRAAIARTLTQDPELLLLDEPFGALDAMTREHLNQELLRIQRFHDQTIFMVTHAINEAVFLANRVLVLSQRPGTIKCDIPIDLPHPRTIDLLVDPAYLALVAQVRHAIDTPATMAPCN